MFYMAFSCCGFGRMKSFVRDEAREARSMTMRTIRSTVMFRRPFFLKGVDRFLPPGDYSVVMDEELIEGLSFSAYHRVSTLMLVPAQSGSAVEMVTIEPLELEAALERDAGSSSPDEELGNASRR
jgi:hypothetical protein